jgi:hypothetical protein
MDVSLAQTRTDKRDYLLFVDAVYRSDSHYRNINVWFLENFLFQKDAYARRCDVTPLLVREGGRVLAAATCVTSDDSDLLRLSFLEFLPDGGPAVAVLLEQARSLARARGKKRIVVGVNGQVGYGLGILENDGTVPFEFGANYHPPYYVPVLDTLGLEKKRAHAFRFDLADVNRQRDDRLLDGLRRDYVYRRLDLGRFKQEMRLFGELCDQTLGDTPYYTPKSAAEMSEEMLPLRFLLRPEDLIFVLHKGREVGFVLAHPNYSEHLQQRSTTQRGFFLNAIRWPSTSFIINCVGVVEEHRGVGLALGLPYEWLRLVDHPVTSLVSSFVLDDNMISARLCRSRSASVHRVYSVYETAV